MALRTITVNQKAWYSSKTLWTGIATVVAGLVTSHSGNATAGDPVTIVGFIFTILRLITGSSLNFSTDDSNVTPVVPVTPTPDPTPDPTPMPAPVPEPTPVPVPDPTPEPEPPAPDPPAPTACRCAQGVSISSPTKIIITVPEIALQTAEQPPPIQVRAIRTGK